MQISLRPHRASAATGGSESQIYRLASLLKPSHDTNLPEQRLFSFPQSRQCREALQIIAQRLCRSAPEGQTLAAKNFPGQDTRLATKHHAFLDACVLTHAHLSADHDVVLNNNAARKSCLGGDDH